MTTIYELLRARKGAAYKPEQLFSKSFLVTNPEITKHAGALAGLSRIYGDAAPNVQNSVIDLLVEMGARYKLPYRDIAHLLLLCKIESGFNPDAAAGTTTAAGLGQYTQANVEEAGKFSPKLLGFKLDLSGLRVFDAELGAFGVVLSFMKCKERAIESFGKDYEKYLYLFHHEGWYFKPTPEHLAQPRPTEVLGLIRDKILPQLGPLESLLSQKTDVSMKLLTKDGQPHPDQPYVALFPTAGRSKDAPASVQDAKAEDVSCKVGRTDAQGKTAPIAVPALWEVVFVLLNPDYEELRHVQTPAQSYTVKSKDNLSRIAAENGTTVDELQRINHIANPDQLKVGQTLVLHDGSYLGRKPSPELVAKHLQVAVNATPAAASVIVEHQASHIVLPQGNEAQKHAGEDKTIALRGNKSADEVKARKKQEDVPHKTVEEKIKKVVETPVVKGKPLRAGMLFPLPTRYPDTDAGHSYKTGARVFGYPREPHRKHGGRDLYAPAGTPVRAVDDGKIIQVYEFYCDTDAVEVDHGGFIVRYGEVCKRDKHGREALFGKEVKKGDVLGEVGTLMMVNKKTKKKEPYKFSMCHFELYSSTLSPSKKGLTDKSAQGGPFQRRSDLVDPVDTLDACIVDPSYWNK